MLLVPLGDHLGILKSKYLCGLYISRTKLIGMLIEIVTKRLDQTRKQARSEDSPHRLLMKDLILAMNDFTFPLSGPALFESGGRGRIVAV